MEPDLLGCSLRFCLSSASLWFIGGCSSLPCSLFHSLSVVGNGILHSLCPLCLGRCVGKTFVAFPMSKSVIRPDFIVAPGAGVHALASQSVVVRLSIGVIPSWYHCHDLLSQSVVVVTIGGCCHILWWSSQLVVVVLFSCYHHNKLLSQSVVVVTSGGCRHNQW